MSCAARRLALGLVAIAAATGVIAQTTGGRTCVRSNILCITATANASTTLYELEYTGSDQPGWMAIGFGQQMVSSPMVILWSNTDGSVTLSQRISANYDMPTPIKDPPRVASVDASGTNAAAAKPTFAFTIPTDPDTQTKQSLIWGIGTENPGSTNPDATITEHGPGMNGIITLDISTPVDSGDSSGSGSSNNGTSSGGSANDLPTQTGSLPALTNPQKLIIAHAILFAIGFLLLLPAGALFARLLRTVTPNWFKGHWIIQFGLAAPILLIGLATSIAGVAQRGGEHFDDNHKRLGLVLCILYIIQCSLGAFIHFVKDPNRARRPPQNYFHAFVGILIIVLAFPQVRTGYKDEWPDWSGRGSVGNGVNILWIVWIVLLPVLYFGGLAFLPKQFKMEQRQLEEREASNYAMQRSASRRRAAAKNGSYESETHPRGTGHRS